MSDLTVGFSGLFAVVRHRDQSATTLAEPMDILYPKDDGGLHGGHLAHMHTPTLHVPTAAVKGVVADVLERLKPVPHGGIKDYSAFDLSGWSLHLPVAETPEDVAHSPDETIFSEKELADEIAVGLVGPDADWTPLTRLPVLGDLTAKDFDIDVKHPDPQRIDAIVALSGGRLECVRSTKALRDAFFEFFTESETLLVQPAAEDTKYTVNAPNGTITLGISRIHGALPKIHEFPLAVDGLAPLKVTSLPVEGAARPTDLNHFFNYYKLMKQPSQKPFVRVLSRRDEQLKKIVHTMPGIKAFDLTANNLPHNERTVDTCSCLAAQVFAGARSKTSQVR